MSRIVLENVTKRFGETVAVDNLSLEIDKGYFFSLLGPSGCGKTTTMRLIAGLERPDTGRIWIGDKLVSDANSNTFLPPAKRGLGMVFQNYALWPHMTVRDNVLFGLKVRRIPKDVQKKRMLEVMERLQIGELGARYPHELSGGQQQRVALARELVTGASVLLMDEPLSNLDAKLRIDMRLELKRLHEETGGTFIYVTHDQIEALTLSTHMVVMKDGLMQQVDTPNRVFAYPLNMFVASFMGSAPINVLQGEIANGRLRSNCFDLPLPDYIQNGHGERKVIIAVRPEEMFMVREKDEWTVGCYVESVMSMGYTVLLHVHIGNKESGQLLTVEHDQRNGVVSEGEETYLRFDSHNLHVFDIETEERLGSKRPDKTMLD